jgi:WD40 repeat protein
LTHPIEEYRFDYSKIARISNAQAIALSTSGRHVAIATGDTVRLIRPKDRAVIAEFRLADYVRALMFSADERWFAAADDSGETHLWGWNGQEFLDRWSFRSNYQATSLAFTNDGNFLISGDTGGAATIIDVLSGQPATVLRSDGAIRGIAISPNGTIVATGSEDKTLRVWDWRPADLERAFVGRLIRDWNPLEQRRYPAEETPAKAPYLSRIVSWMMSRF